MRDKENVFIVESPISMIEGETIRFSVEWLGASKLAYPLMAVYQHGKEISNSVLLGLDDFEISGNVLTLKKITARLNDGGTEYVVLIQSNVDVNVECRKLVIEVVKAKLPGS